MNNCCILNLAPVMRSPPREASGFHVCGYCLRPRHVVVEVSFLETGRQARRRQRLRAETDPPQESRPLCSLSRVWSIAKFPVPPIVVSWHGQVLVCTSRFWLSQVLRSMMRFFANKISYSMGARCLANCGEIGRVASVAARVLMCALSADLSS